MSADDVLQRLEGVRETGPGRWIACCPAHDDKSPSLSVRATGDGRTLIHCFAGCGALEVLGAAGLDWSALYPPRDPTIPHTTKAPPVPYADALRAIGNEAFVVLIAAGNTERGVVLHDADMRRLTLAVQRIVTACEVTRAWR